MRIVAGTAGGRKLVAPKGDGTRPMTDRVKEALFSSLGAVVVGSHVLDLFAGSGALGLESLSRGAATVTFVERDRKALESLGRNIEAVGLGGEVVAGTVERFLAGAQAPAGGYHLAFVDPPYALPLASASTILASLVPLLAAGATVVLHRRRGDDPPVAPEGVEATDRRTYGNAELFRFVKTAGMKEAW